VAIGSGLVGGNGANSVWCILVARWEMSWSHMSYQRASDRSGLVSSGQRLHREDHRHIVGDVPNAGARSGGISAAGNIHAIVVSGG
jgi:hypothetical protein